MSWILCIQNVNLLAFRAMLVPMKEFSRSWTTGKELGLKVLLTLFGI